MSSTKKTVRVTITREIEVEIADDHLTPTALAAFSESFYETDDPDEMFRNAAQQIARFDVSFVEGIGACRPAHGKGIAPIHYTETYEDVETEIVEGQQC